MICKGFAKKNWKVVLDREEAIREALQLARPGDTVLVAGKGHEDYQLIGEERIEFEDRWVVKRLLRELELMHRVRAEEKSQDGEGERGRGTERRPFRDQESGGREERGGFRDRGRGERHEFRRRRDD